MTIALRQKPAFKQAYKNLHANQREAVHNAMRKLIANPTLGHEKKDDLSGVWAYRFDGVNPQCPLACLWNKCSRSWLALGLRENFSRNLKR
jgi:hypothetical protein